MKHAVAGIVALTVAAGVTASCATSVAIAPPADGDGGSLDATSDGGRSGTRDDAWASTRKDSGPRSDAPADVVGLPDVVSVESGAGDAGSDGATVCSSGTKRACTTTCGTRGTETCSSGAWSACAPPQEVCNLKDDDCDGYCDDILGCRIGVDRSYDSTTGHHFYTTTDSEASCCGYQLESEDYYYLWFFRLICGREIRETPATALVT